MFMYEEAALGRDKDILSTNLDPAGEKGTVVDYHWRPRAMGVESGTVQEPLDAQWRYSDQSLGAMCGGAVKRFPQQGDGDW